MNKTDKRIKENINETDKRIKTMDKKTKAVPTAKPMKKGKKGRVFLALGSNVGEREEYIEQAVYLLDKADKIKVVRRSTNYESQAQGGPRQAPYVNAVVEIETALKPYQLLDAIHEIESTLGREREIEWGPRTIDIDILLFGDLIMSEDNLVIPHPLMHERLFVLKPFKEIAPNVVHPTIDKTITQLHDEKAKEEGDHYDNDLPGFSNIQESYGDDYEKW